MPKKKHFILDCSIGTDHSKFKDESINNFSSHSNNNNQDKNLVQIQQSLFEHWSLLLQYSFPLLLFTILLLH